MARVSWIALVIGIVLASGCMAGDPMTTFRAEAPKYVVPEDNAWDYMVRAGTLANEVDWDEDWPILADALKGDAEVDLQMIDDAYGEALAELRKGLYKECVMPASVFEGPDLGLQGHSGLRSLARVLSLEARGYAAMGDTGKALASARDGLRLARNMSQNGVLIHDLVGIACSSTVAKQVSVALNIERPDAAKLREFVVWNEANRKSWQSVTGTIANEVLWFLPIIDENGMAHMRSGYIAFACSAIDWAKKPAWERGVLAPSPAEAADLSPSYDKYVRKREINDASLAGLSVRCALEAYQSENGSYPEQLAELVPEYIKELPADPFSGDSFKYELLGRSAEEAYTFYSVGPDLVDDRGLEWDGTDGDLVFGPIWETYKRPAND